KCVVTAMSVMRMVELGQVRLNDPVAKYIPEFGSNGKDQITIRQLATHFSGLREDLDLRSRWQGKDAALRMAHDEAPVAPPGSQFRYSDVNYIVLGELVERVSGISLDGYADAHVFKPLGMTRTRFLPPKEWLGAIAPTEYDERNVMLRGVVHDPTARRMGGVAGHAGLFSTADDIARFAQAMLGGKTIISEASVQKMTTPQQPPTATVLRGIGWDLDSPFSSNRGELLPLGSYGHTGFTGTSLWIDPVTNTYIVLLTNGVHPKLKPGGAVVALRVQVANAVAAALKLSVSEKEKVRLASVTGYNEAIVGARRVQSRNGQVKTGLDVLAESNFGTLSGELGTSSAPKRRRIGLVTNQTGLDAQGRRAIDLLAKAPGVELAAIFSPEHGVTGTLDTTDIGNTKDQATGVPVY
ncbi:MAG TPA: serine hydrolase, partial [Clostridia bacterium]|nr:serine hydrolase [Clostridia bacterium]